MTSGHGLAAIGCILLEQHMDLNFWSTLEIDCVARDLSYSDYLRLHATQVCTSKPLCAEAYRLLHNLLDAEIDSANNPE
jgi:hypothetical protein